MKIRHISHALAIVMLAVMAFSCQPEEENPAGGETEPPVLVSSDPEDGATGIVGDAIDLTMVFDRNVMCPTAQRELITVDNDAVIDGIEAYMTEVTVSLSGLDAGQTYTVTFPEGTITGYSENPAAGIRISFSTREEVTLEDQEISETLVTENPIPAAEGLYDYLRSIYGSQTLSGAMANVAWNTDEAEWVNRFTGKYPAIAFFDYIHLASSPANWIDYGDISPVKDWWNAGGLVGAGWHWNVPVSEGSTDMTFNIGIDTDGDRDNDIENTFSAANAVVEGTWENEVINADLEKIADYLMLLQNEGIPVLWRPLHEAAGNTYTYNTGAWFWWGADGAQAYKDLWIYVFEYFREAGLRNLIWVWTSQTSTASDADFDFYPGDGYVDIIGKDIYNDTDVSSLSSQFNTVISYSTHKMVTLSELGNVTDMASQWNAGAQWLYFMPWYDYDLGEAGYDSEEHSNADISWWKAAFASDAVITRDELPAGLHQ